MTPEELHEQFTKYTKAQNFTIITVIRATKSEAKEIARQAHHTLCESDINAALKRTLRVTTEERDTRQAVLGPNEERVVKLTHQIEYLAQWLPQQMDDDTLTELVTEAIEATAATSMRDMRAIIAYVAENATADFENSDVSRIAKPLLLGK